MWFASFRRVREPNAAEPSEDAPSPLSPRRSSQPHGYSLRISSSDPNPRPQSSRNRALASAIAAAATSSACDLGGGCGASGGGGLLSWIFSARAARADEGKPAGVDWDAHGLPVTHTAVPLSRLDGRKRYKVSELDFLDRRARDRASAAEKNPLFDDMAALRLLPGGVYTRSQLLGWLEAMTSSGQGRI